VWKISYLCNYQTQKKQIMDFKETRKEELYSQSIPAGKRRYFFDVKETKGGDKFIVITESRKIFDNNTGEFYFDKNKMFLYKEDFDKFRQGLDNALSFISTGIVPPPVVVEDDYRPRSTDTGDINLDGSAALDDINFKI